MRVPGCSLQGSLYEAIGIVHGHEAALLLALNDRRHGPWLLSSCDAAILCYVVELFSCREHTGACLVAVQARLHSCKSFFATII